MEEVILPELLSDNLSNGPDDICNYSQSDIDVSVTEKNCVAGKNYSDSETSYEESDSTSDAGATTWVKEGRTPNLGPFTGNSGVKQISCDPAKLSGIIELFFGDNLFKILCKETNRYYFQNEGKYDNIFKALKWVDISVVCATHKRRSETRYICKFCLVPLHKRECLQRYHTLKHYYEPW
jgi:hypothetical protein